MKAAEESIGGAGATRAPSPAALSMDLGTSYRERKHEFLSLDLMAYGRMVLAAKREQRRSGR